MTIEFIKKLLTLSSIYTAPHIVMTGVSYYNYYNMLYNNIMYSTSCFNIYISRWCRSGFAHFFSSIPLCSTVRAAAKPKFH